MRGRRAAAFLAVLGVLSAGAEDVPGNRFVFAQVRRAGEENPHPGLWEVLAPMLRDLTRLDPWPTPRVLAPTDEALADFPFLYVTGRGDPRLTDEDLSRLRDHLASGGFLFIDNAEAALNGPFDRAVRAWPGRLFGGTAWRPVPRDHALYRSFFLLSGASGRRRVSDVLWGGWAGDRLVAVYCANDLSGALAQDRLDQPLFPCEPGGEPQRVESRKLWVNIVLFSLTGTYKTDAVHQPFLEKKRRTP